MINREMSVGLIFLVGFATLSYMVSQLSSSTALQAGSKVYYALVDDSSGLFDGSAVKIAGIEVGRMKEKILNNDKAQLVLEISTNQKVHVDAIVTIRSIGYLGDRYMDLDPGSEGRPLLPAESFIHAYEGATFESLMENSDSLLQSWTNVARSLRNLIGS